MKKNNENKNNILQIVLITILGLGLFSFGIYFLITSDIDFDFSKLIAWICIFVLLPYLPKMIKIHTDAGVVTFLLDLILSLFVIFALLTSFGYLFFNANGRFDYMMHLLNVMLD